MDSDETWERFVSSIPMRGQEELARNHRGYGRTRSSIPMRGQEIVVRRGGRGRGGRSSIPMRGQENVQVPDTLPIGTGHPSP